MAVARTDDLDRAHPERVVYLLVLMPFLFSFGLLLGLLLGVRGQDLIQLSLALLTTAIAALPLILDQGRPPAERHVLLSMFSLVFILGFVLPVLVIFMPAEGPIEAPSFAWSAVFPIDVIRGQLATLLGLACLLIGYASPVGRLLTAFLPRFRSDWPPDATLAVAGIIIPLGWAIQLSGLFTNVFEGLGSGFFGILASSYLYGIALLSIAFLRHRSPTALLMLAVVVPITSFFGLFTGSKSAILIPGIMVVLSIILVRRRIGARWIVLGVLAATLAFPVGKFVRDDILANNTLTTADALRNPAGTLGRVSSFLTGSRPGEYLMGGILHFVARMDCIGAASVLIRDTPSVAPFQHGKTLGVFFLAFVPRVLWPGKPTITVGRYITDVYGSGPEINSNTAPTQLGEFFMNFGYPGIIGGMLLYGLLLRVAHEILLRGRPTTPALFVAVVVLFRLGIGFQGDTANNFAVTVTSIVPIILAHIAVRSLFPTRARPISGFEPGGSSAAVER